MLTYRINSCIKSLAFFIKVLNCFPWCNANGVSEISGNVPAVMAQTFEAVREATGIDMKEIVRANSYDAKVTKNVNLVSDSTIVSEKNDAQDAE